MQILFFKYYILVFNDSNRIMEQIYISIRFFQNIYILLFLDCISIFMKIHQFDGLIYIDQLLQNNENEITMNKKEQYQANDDCQSS